MKNANRSMRLGWTFLLMVALCLVPALLRAQEVEPNSSCMSAQDLSGLGLPVNLTGQIAGADVDFYRFSGTPGSTVRVSLQGQSSGQGTLSDPLVGIYDGGCSTLLSVNDDSGSLDSRTEFMVPDSGSFVVAATSYADYSFTGAGYGSGSYRLIVEEFAIARSVSGRVVDAETGSPVEYASVRLYRCQGGSCNEFVGQTWTYSYFPYSTAEFRFDVYNLYSPLVAGEYRILVEATNYESMEVGPFYLAAGQDLDLGQIALTPLPRVGSISGRLVDLVTGAPLASSTARFAEVELEYCYDEWYCYPVRYTVPDAGGSFRFEGDSYNPLWPGSYRLRASADQYEHTVSRVFAVAGGHYDYGDLAMKSFPVRIYLGETCGSIPASGGNCRFTMRVVNGSPGRLVGEAWSIITGGPLGTPAGYTTFQPGNPRGVSLAPGESATLPFTVFVPADLANGAVVCAEGFAAQRPHSFNTLGRHQLFCLYKGYGGFSRVSDEQRRDGARRSRGEDPRPPHASQHPDRP